MRRFTLPTILAVMPLVACLPDDDRTYVVSQAPQVAAAEPPPEAPPPPPAEAPLPERKPVAAVAEPAEFDPKALVGLGFREIEAMLGEPTRQEERAPAKIWSYESGDCVLSIFFYADINTREFRALTYEVKENYSTNDGGADEQCLSHWMPRT